MLTAILVGGIAGGVYTYFVWTAGYRSGLVTGHLESALDRANHCGTPYVRQNRPLGIGIVGQDYEEGDTDGR